MHNSQPSSEAWRPERDETQGICAIQGVARTARSLARHPSESSSVCSSGRGDDTSVGDGLPDELGNVDHESGLSRSGSCEGRTSPTQTQTTSFRRARMTQLLPTVEPQTYEWTGSGRAGTVSHLT